MRSHSERRNPFYLLLLIASVIFVITALAYAFVPVLAERARVAGADVPSSPWRLALEKDGWLWLLYEVAAMVLLGLASMGLDRYRRWQQERALRTDSASIKSAPAHSNDK